LLQNVSAPGNRQALWAALTAPDVLRDSAPTANPPLTPHDIELRILNNYLLEVGVKAESPNGLEMVVENLGYNFIQALLAPERMRVEQLLSEAQNELVQLEAMPQPLSATAQAQMSRAITAVAQLQSDLRLLNNTFAQQGGQALIWFTEAARVQEPTTGLARWITGILLGIAVGGGLGFSLHRAQARWRPAVNSAAEAQAISGLPVIGTLPWLNNLVVTQQGSRVSASGKALSPVEFSEITRLYRTVMRSLRGPLMVVSPNGEEGASTVALLMAEKSASEGKETVLADFNLKNRSLTEKLLLGEGSWALPSGKGPWTALRQIGHHLQALPAPRHMAALQGLAEQGGIPALLAAAQKAADVVVIDASPLTATNRGNLDAVTLGTHASRTVLVVQQGITAKHQLKQAADQLLLAGVSVQGVIINQQFSPSRRQRLLHLADILSWLLPPLGRTLAKAVRKSALE
jgi:Mrp family chromosome partitioning ATPase